MFPAGGPRAGLLARLGLGLLAPPSSWAAPRAQRRGLLRTQPTSALPVPQNEKEELPERWPCRAHGSSGHSYSQTPHLFQVLRGQCAPRASPSSQSRCQWPHNRVTGRPRVIMPRALGSCVYRARGNPRHPVGATGWISPCPKRGPAVSTAGPGGPGPPPVSYTEHGPGRSATACSPGPHIWCQPHSWPEMSPSRVADTLHSAPHSVRLGQLQLPTERARSQACHSRRSQRTRK